MAASRGWVVGHGLPDEARAGRAILKAYCDGQLLACEWPPGHAGAERQRARLAAERRRRSAPPGGATADAGARSDGTQGAEQAGRGLSDGTSSEYESDSGEDSRDPEPVLREEPAEARQADGAAEGVSAVDLQSQRPDSGGALRLSTADLELMDEMKISIGAAVKWHHDCLCHALEGECCTPQ